jgi:deoxyhypusine synthase
MHPNSLFHHAPDIIPQRMPIPITVPELLRCMGQTCFEARNVFRGAELFKRMILENNTLWLGIAGAGIAGGMGGIVISLLEAGFIDAICSTGAQIYHDLHFAFDLPVKAIHPQGDDDLLRQHGDVRIYDIGIRDQETLSVQDALIRQFVRERYDLLAVHPLASWEFNYHLGLWVNATAPHPERSFTAVAANLGTPIFWDSLANHSIALNLMRTDREGFPVTLSAQKDIFDSAALAFFADKSGFVELGGGGPKNFIQQTGPTLSQILCIEFDGAEQGLQIGTAVERDGSLSSCTFNEAVTWGKYCAASEENLVQIWGEYSVILPLISAYVLELCPFRLPKNLIMQFPQIIAKLEAACPSKDDFKSL